MNILTVDDSKTMRHIIVKTLNELGYNIIFEAGSVEEAKSVLDRENISLIISDWNMPGASGLDLLKYVRAHPKFSQILFIMNTTEQDKKNIFEAVKNGVQSYMIKPVQKNVLAQKLYDLSVSHGIKAPVVERGMKITAHPSSKESPPTENDAQDKRENVAVISRCDFSTKMEITREGKFYTLFPAQTAEGQLPELLNKALPNVKLALVSDAVDPATIDEALKDLQSKYHFNFVLEC